MIRSCLHGLVALAVMAPAPLLAAAETESTRQGGPDTVGSLASLSLGLIAVIALIFGCAWLVKRMSGLSGMNSQAMKVVSVMNLNLTAGLKTSADTAEPHMPVNHVSDRRYMSRPVLLG